MLSPHRLVRCKKKKGGPVMIFMEASAHTWERPEHHQQCLYTCNCHAALSSPLPCTLAAINNPEAASHITPQSALIPQRSSCTAHQQQRPGGSHPQKP